MVADPPCISWGNMLCGAVKKGMDDRSYDDTVWRGSSLFCKKESPTLRLLLLQFLTLR